MKARAFSRQLAEAGRTCMMVDPNEPHVVVRKDHNGEEFVVKTVKVRKGLIIIEY